MTFKFLFKSLVLSAALIGVTACSKDDDKWPVVDGEAPQITLALSRIRTDYDLTFKIQGKIADKDGIKSIRLVCPGLSLDKEIDIIELYQKPLTEYDLDYSYTVKPDYLTEFTGSYTVEVTVTDVAGNTDTQEVLVTFDADFQAPTFVQSPDTEVTVLIKDKTMFNLKFTVEDNRNLDYIEVNLEGVEGYPVRIEANGEPKISYANKLELPSTPKNYNLTIKAYDMPAQDEEVRSTEIKSLVKVQHLPDFDRLYLADVLTAEELNSDVFGVPMVCDHVGPYQYSVRYYNEKAGTQVCFIPQKTDFLPICFGPDPDDETVLADDPEVSGKITLDQGGVYYKIDVNTKTGAYKVSSYSIVEAVDPIQNLHYGQNDLNTWAGWDKPSEIWWQEWYFGPSYSDLAAIPERKDTKVHSKIEVRMVRDSKNPHIWVSEDWDLKAGEMTEWLLHNWHHDGWWNYTSWRVDDSADPSRCEYFGFYFPDNEHFNSNKAFFENKYVKADPTQFKYMYPDNNGAAFSMETWGTINEAYAKKFVPDIKVKCTIPVSGKYRIWFDAHAERIKLLPVK